MTQLLRGFVTVRYPYQEAARQTRAQMLVPLAEIAIVLAFVHGLMQIGMALNDPGSVSEWSWAATVGALSATVLILSLTQRGYVDLAAALLGGTLFAIAGVSLWMRGIDLRPIVLLPIALVYMGLIYRGRGAIWALVLTWSLLIGAGYLQSEGKLDAPQIALDALRTDILVAGGGLTTVALLLGSFSWTLEQALQQASRITTLTRATAATGQELSRILSLDELLTKAADLIRDRFAVYHVQIFIADETQPFANLAASTGRVGSALLAQGFRVALNADTVPGEVMMSGTERYIADITHTTYKSPDLLADTRTELALPLIIGSDIVGVLDVHSARPSAFGTEDIETMRILANQVSQAINNARLFEAQQRSLLQNRRLFLDSETNLREIERLNRQITGQAWQEYTQEHATNRMGIHLHKDGPTTPAPEWTKMMRQATERNRTMLGEEGNEQVFAVPINIRGEPIGAIEVRIAGERNPAEVRNVLQTVAERMAFSLENARLFEQARMIAERERQINQVTAQLQGLTSVEDVLNMAVSALAEALDAERGQIRLIAPDALKPATPTSPGTNGHSAAPQPDQDQEL